VDLVVEHIRGASGAPGRAAVDAWRHGQQRLIGQMVSLVEDAALEPAVLQPTVVR
jgi:hypothetical protein